MGEFVEQRRGVQKQSDVEVRVSRVVVRQRWRDSVETRQNVVDQVVVVVVVVVVVLVVVIAVVVVVNKSGETMKLPAALLSLTPWL